jgi:hypothetical protein
VLLHAVLCFAKLKPYSKLLPHLTLQDATEQLVHQSPRVLQAAAAAVKAAAGKAAVSPTTD